MPARCPSCNQVYTDETLSFCPNDGTPLIKDAPSAYDPQATMLAQPPPVYPQLQQPPPPQQGYYAPQGGQAPPPPQGGQAPPQGWQQPPYGQQQQFPPQYGAPPIGGGKSSKLPLIIALAAIVLIGGGVGLYFLLRDNSSSSSRKVDVNVSTPSNTSTRTTNTSSTSTFPTPTTTVPTTTTSNTDETSTSTASDYSDDEKHKLFQAVGITRDNELIIEVAEKIGLSDSRGNPTPAMAPFVKEHYAWAVKNAAWVKEHLDPAKAREYVMAHK